MRFFHFFFRKKLKIPCSHAFCLFKKNIICQIAPQTKILLMTFYLPFIKKWKYVALMIFFDKNMHLSKRPHTLKYHFVDFFLFLVIFGGKNQITPLSCFFNALFFHKNQWSKLPHTLKSCFLPFLFWGKKTKLHCYHAFLWFFLPKNSFVKTPTHPKIVFS